MNNHQQDFDQSLEKDISIEPKDWMPDAYRKNFNSSDWTTCTL
jgi:ring-1,2-phenylacetyl-CoA epoxidase subunit PaaA